MKILLFGHDGQIGWELERRLAGIGTVRGISYPDIDFARPEQIRAAVRDEKPGLIINAAAYTAVDKAEQEPDIARAINATAPAVIAREAGRAGAILVHYSTDFVFDGKKREPYTEEDVPNPLSVYGQTKLEGDRAVLSEGARCFIFRTSWIYGLRGKNFLLTMRRLAEAGKQLRVVDDQTGCPTWCGAVAKATVSVLEQVCGPRPVVPVEDIAGLYNMSCSGAVSWCGFAKAFLPEPEQVKAISTEEYPTPAIRPGYSVMNCSRLHNTFGIDMPSWEQALAECLRGND